jgi:UDP-N-acetyl-D-galactosamine dehydrogenase
MGINTLDVLEAAGTKWNFLPFRPGLVGGHCIGVDPYYLTHKAESIGYRAEIILAGRRLNDSMGSYVAGQLIKAMLKRRIQVNGARVLIMGLTFKENCPDLRNTKVIDVIRELEQFGVQIDVWDPIANSEDASQEYGVILAEEVSENSYDGILIAVAHEEFLTMGLSSIRSLGKPADHILYDLKGILPAGSADLTL